MRVECHDCGKTPIKPNLNGFIVGGVEARPNSIPWQAGIRYSESNDKKWWQWWKDNFKAESQFCGGSIISVNMVITAASKLVSS